MFEFIEYEGLRFEIRRVPRRRRLTIGLRPNGSARVSTWMGCTQKVIQEFLSEKKDWIISVKSRFHQLRKDHPQLLIQEDGKLPFLGRELMVQIVRQKLKKNLSLRIDNDKLVFETPEVVENLQSNEAQEKLRHILRKHYHKVGTDLIAKRVQHWVQKTGLNPNKISFRGQRTRWGSCSPRGHISLNWKLVCASIELIDYVIIHELCHLKHLNHSKSFWSLVEKHCPTWKEKKIWLQENVFGFDFLNEKSELHEPKAGSVTGPSV